MKQDSLYGRARHVLARRPFLRSGYYLLRSIRDAIKDGPAQGRAELDQEFTAREDPWDYHGLDQAERIHAEIAVLNTARGTEQFHCALEIGCAEGAFTEQLAPLCELLTAADISPVALQRAQKRLQHLSQVEFALWDMRQDCVRETHDLIVAVHALEYVRNPLAMRRVRNKLVNSLRPGGYLLVGTMKMEDIYEEAWWSRFLLRSSTHINRFFARHPDLSIVQTLEFRLGKNHQAGDVLLRKRL